MRREARLADAWVPYEPGAEAGVDLWQSPDDIAAARARRPTRTAWATSPAPCWWRDERAREKLRVQQKKAKSARARLETWRRAQVRAERAVKKWAAIVRKFEEKGL